MPWSHTFFGSLKGRMMLANKKKTKIYHLKKYSVFQHGSLNLFETHITSADNLVNLAIGKIVQKVA